RVTPAPGRDARPRCGADHEGAHCAGTPKPQWTQATHVETDRRRHCRLACLASTRLRLGPIRVCALLRLHPLLWTAGFHLGEARRLWAPAVHFCPARAVSPSLLRSERLLLALPAIVRATFPRPRDRPLRRAAGACPSLND